MKLIKLDDVLKILGEYADGFNGELKIIPNISPIHGSCCTCQICGYNYDDCVCMHNNLVERIISMFNTSKAQLTLLLDCKSDTDISYLENILHKSGLTHYSPPIVELGLIGFLNEKPKGKE